MKRLHSIIAGLMLVAAASVLSSCDLGDDDDETAYNTTVPTAMVTVKPATLVTQFYLQLNDSTSLLPANIGTSPYGDKEVRAYVNYTINNEASSLIHDQAVNVNWLDSILTKQMVPDMGEENVARYGNDPVEIVKGWETIAEDGYLTIRFRTRWGGDESHSVNLSYTKDDQGKLTAVFHHNANGDAAQTVGDGIVAFRLDEEFNKPDTPYEFTLKWNSYSGEKSTTFKYIPRKY